MKKQPHVRAWEHAYAQEDWDYGKACSDLVSTWIEEAGMWKITLHGHVYVGKLRGIGYPWGLCVVDEQGRDVPSFEIEVLEEGAPIRISAHYARFEQVK